MYYIYGREGCSYCVAAKNLLDKLNLDVTYFDIRQDPDKKEELLQKIPAVKTVPQIFYNGTYIGGYTELSAKLKS